MLISQQRNAYFFSAFTTARRASTCSCFVAQLAQKRTPECVVHTLPVLIAEAFAQNGQLVIRHDGILLVGGGVEQQGIARGDENVPDLMSHLDGVAGNLRKPGRR